MKNSTSFKNGADCQWAFYRTEEENVSGNRCDALSNDKKALLLVQQLIADQLKITVDKVDIKRGYFDMGITSIGLAKVAQSIEKKIDVPFQTLLRLLLEYGNIAALSSYLADHYTSTLEQLIVTKQ